MQWIILIFVIGVVAFWYYHNRIQLASVPGQLPPGVLYQTWTEIPYSITQPGRDHHWNRALLIIKSDHVRLISKYKKAVLFNAQVSELRGFWLVKNEIWLHAHIGSEWYIVKIRPLDRRSLLDVFQQLTPQTQQPALEPAPYPATSSEDDAVTLYLAPYTLVVSRHGLVQHAIDSRSITTIEHSDEALTFTTNEQTYAFTMTESDQWAQALRKVIYDSRKAGVYEQFGRV
jgi:hypothetical protein